MPMRWIFAAVAVVTFSLILSILLPCASRAVAAEENPIRRNDLDRLAPTLVIRVSKTRSWREPLTFVARDAHQPLVIAVRHPQFKGRRASPRHKAHKMLVGLR